MVVDSLKALDPKRPIREGLGHEDRQAPRDEEGNRGAGAPVGGDHAPHLGGRHRVPVDPGGYSGVGAVQDQTREEENSSSAERWNDVPRGTMDEVSSYVCLVLPSTDGKAARKIVPPRLRIPYWKGLGADSEEKHEPVSDIDTVVVDSLKALDPKRPIREADITLRTRYVRFVPIAEIGSITIVQKQCCGTRQNYLDFGELGWLRFDPD